MRLVLSRCTVRPFARDDAASLALHANDRGVWRNLRDLFPHPYALKDAQNWLARTTQEPWTSFALEVEGAAVGGIGYEPQSDVYRHTAEIGYWLGREYWGRGIVSEAIDAFARELFASRCMTRLEAGVYAWNPGSMRALEKAGFLREACMRKAAFKDGEFVDVMLYARVKG